MRQIISGETHKTKVLNKISIKSFLEENLNIFNNVLELKFLYEDKKILNDPVLNYINLKHELDFIKDILRKEYDDCEKIYPHLGDVFINFFFDNLKNNKRKKFKFSKKDKKDFFTTIKNSRIKDISNLIFENASLEYMINVEKYNGEEIIFEKKPKINLNIEFDHDYFKQEKNKKVKNYNCIIIDGIIDTVGEIHHLLHKASENKEDYVVFCLGINEEVKNTIMINNKRNITKIWPININLTEKTLNSLNDIGIIHDTDIITATKGQTISQEIRNEFKKCKEIIINQNSLSIVPVCSLENLYSHRNFIYKRIEEADHTENKKLLKDRYKSLSIKTLNIYLPDILCDAVFVRELDYLLKFISNLNKVFTNIKINNKKYYIPSNFIDFAFKKSINTKKIMNNIEKIITLNTKETT